MHTELIRRSECEPFTAAGSATSCTSRVLLTRRCPDTRGLFCNLGSNRCAFYVAGSPEFRCRCPHRWSCKAGRKTCLWNFRPINAGVTAGEPRSEWLTFLGKATCSPGADDRGEKLIFLHLQSFLIRETIPAHLLLGGLR